MDNTAGDGTARTCYYCTGSTGATDTTTLEWWLNSWTLPVTGNKRIIGLAVWLASETGITAFMPGTITDNPANGLQSIHRRLRKFLQSQKTLQRIEIGLLH
jgi:hypothetical protein